jgi:hypothetical protein
LVVNSSVGCAYRDIEGCRLMFVAFSLAPLQAGTGN